MLGPSRETGTHLGRILDDSLDCAVDLKQILELEHDALQQQDDEALTDAAAAKERVMRKMQVLEDERHNFCAKSGFGAEPAAMSEMIRNLELENDICERWDRLLAVGQECGHINMLNGAIISVRRRQIESNLAVLRGANPGVETYESDGTESSALGSRRLGDA